MAISNHLKTSDHSGVRDMSLPDSGGVITQGSEPGFSTDECSGSESAPAPIKEISTKAEGATSPVVANLDTMKSVGVAKNPGMMRAHQLGSITNQDHKDVHAPDKCEMKSEGQGMTTITSLASGDQKTEKSADRPATYEGGRSLPLGSRMHYRDHQGKIRQR